MLRQILLCLIFLTLIGCTAHHAGVSSYQLIRASEFENVPDAIGDSEDFASLIIKRDQGFQASALPAKMHLNGLFLTNVKEGQYIELRVRPGEHTLLLKTNGLGLVPFSHMLEIYVSNESTNYYRIHPGWPDGMQLSESAD